MRVVDGAGKFGVVAACGVLVVATTCRPGAPEDLEESAVESATASAEAARIAAIQERAPASYAFALDHGGVARATSAGRRLGVTVDVEALHVAPARSAAWALDLRLHAIGRSGDAARVERGHLVVDANKATLRRDVVDEWYVNGPLGIEHGFTVSERPPGDGALVLSLAVDGLAPAQEVIGGEVLLRDARGRTRARYGRAFASDARGRALGVELVTGHDRVDIRVDDRDATYPIAIDPLVWMEQDALLPVELARDDMMDDVAISGDTAVVCGPYYDHAGILSAGSAFVFERSGGVWSETQMLLASDVDDSDYFCLAADIDGDTLAIGALFDDQPGIENAGAVYVFVRSGGVFVEEQKLVASTPLLEARLGASVALSGDTIVAGTVQSSAYVFAQSGGTWTEEQVLVASDAPVVGYGRAVAIDGDTAVVGAYSIGTTNPGAAYVYVRSAGVWSEQQKLTAAGAPSAAFGFSVAASADTALIGASGEDVGGFTGAGAAYFFTRSAGVWTEQQMIAASSPGGNDRFGSDVALEGGRAVVGAFGDDDAGADAGAVYVFELSGAVWSEQSKLTSANTTSLLGEHVGLSGDTIIAGGEAFGMPAYVFGLENCSVDSNCPSALCVAGVCCDTPCEGACEACDLPGSEGVCTPSPAGAPGAPPCAPYLCAGNASDCPMTCATDDDCVDAVCLDGACEPLLANGAPCGVAGDCASGFCADGYCCDTACGAQCEACDVAGTLGTCAMVSGAPHGDRPPCDGASCDAGVATEAATCDGIAPVCVAGATTNCAPYGCDGDLCATCATDATCDPDPECLDPSGCPPAASPTASDEPSGCGCRLVSGVSATPGAGVLLALALALARSQQRRRRRDRPATPRSIRFTSFP